MMEQGIQLSNTYDPARVGAYHLSVLVGEGLSAWCAHDTTTGTLHALHWRLDDDALASPHVPVQPHRVSFVALPEWNTLVPDGALATGTEARHLSLVHGRVPPGAMRDEPVQHLGATCIYVHDDRLEHRVMDRFAHARPLAMGVLMVQAARRLATEPPWILMHRGADRLDIAVHHHHGLQLCNTYPVHSAADVLYFALLACDRTGHQAADSATYLAGTHLTAPERELIARYFGHPLAPTTGNWADVSEGQATSPDRWLALTEQFACVS